MNHWNCQLLRVNLTDGVCSPEQISPLILTTYLGGRGLGVRLLRDSYVKDPFNADASLIFTTGPLCGTSAPGSSTLSVIARSPLTSTVFHDSAESSLAEQLKSVGYDALVITGTSPVPVVLAISESQIRLLPAHEWWGTSLSATMTALSSLGSVAAIGPAGEQQVLYASIATSDGTTLARGGLGALMGAKQLKAIALNGPVSDISIAAPLRFTRAHDNILRLIKASPVLSGTFGFGRYGTPAMVDLLAQRRMLPVKNFTATFADNSSACSAIALDALCHPHPNGCHSCPVLCRKTSDVWGELPGYDSLASWAFLLGPPHLEACLSAHHICGELGIDGISAAGTIACWSEINGYYPSASELPELLHQIARRTGPGRMLALGSRRIARQLGHPNRSMTVKSLELPPCDPRGAYGTALSFAVSTHGATDHTAYPLSHEVLRKPAPTDRFSFTGKARMVAIAEDTIAAMDSLSVCTKLLLGASLEEYAELLSAVTGEDYSAERLKHTGEQIVLTERFYNCMNGITAHDDILPERFFNEPGSSGNGIPVPPLDRRRFMEERDAYYRIRRLGSDGTFPDHSLTTSLP